MMNCNDGVCAKCHGVKKLVWGALLLLNAFVWPQWLGIDGWISFVAVLWVIAGFLKIVWPSCGHCSVPAAMPAKKGKKRKR